ncbi:MAG: carbon-nitrogen hydrolase family protein [Candidatus Dormibacteraceae bacterium]
MRPDGPGRQAASDVAASARLGGAPVFRVALVQPLSHHPPDDQRNVQDAVRYVERAADAGADVVTFPETYPGPFRMPMAFDPAPAICEVARRCGVYVQYGTLEPIDARGTRAHNDLILVGPDGSVAGTYRRTHPPGPWIYRGGPVWDFDYVPGDDFPVMETRHGTFGLAMCSEAYMPEVTRALALGGAEVILLPAGTDKQRLWATWRNLIWSRAIENLAVVITTQNLFSVRDRGLAMVALPEEIVFETVLPGTFIVEIDLTRVRQLRAERDDVHSQERNAAKAGILSQWQRPELYGALRWRGPGGGPIRAIDPSEPARLADQGSPPI